MISRWVSSTSSAHVQCPATLRRYVSEHCQTLFDEKWAIVLGRSTTIGSLTIPRVLGVIFSSSDEYEDLQQAYHRSGNGLLHDVLKRSADGDEFDTLRDVHTHLFSEEESNLSGVNYRDEMEWTLVDWFAVPTGTGGFCSSRCTSARSRDRRSRGGIDGVASCYRGVAPRSVVEHLRFRESASAVRLGLTLGHPILSNNQGNPIERQADALRGDRWQISEEPSIDLGVIRGRRYRSDSRMPAGVYGRRWPRPAAFGWSKWR